MNSRTHVRAGVVTSGAFTCVDRADGTLACFGDNVFGELSGGYEVRGDRLNYDAATEIYHVIGKPVLVKSPNKDKSGCVISRGPEVKLNRRLNTVEWPPGRTDAVGADELVKCDVSIRKTTTAR